MRQDSRILVAGADTMLGAALMRVLRSRGYERAFQELEPGMLADRQKVRGFLHDTAPEYVFAVAGRTGGIEANQTQAADLMLDNLLVSTNVISESFVAGVRKLLYVASSCCYPRDCAQPMAVESLMTGRLEPTSQAYATAKLAGIGLCQAYRGQYGANFITAIPANPFGPGDDFSADVGHVIPALIRRFYEAKLAGEREIVVWGTGTPQREFIHVDDLADACWFVMNRYEDGAPINIGGGDVMSVRTAAEAVARVMEFEGTIRFDPSRPDGMPVKCLDGGALRQLGWRPSIGFESGLARTAAWFKTNVAAAAL